MPSAVVMVPTVSRSSLERMLDLIQKRDEQPKDEPPALPARPTSRGRLPSSRRSLPLNFKIGGIAPEPVSKSSKEVADKEIVPENRVSGSKKSDHLEDHPFVDLPELESYEDGMEDGSVVDSATVKKLGCDHTVDNLLKKIVKSEDAKHQGLHHIIGVQKYIRGVQTRRHYEEVKRGVTTLQSFIRGERARHEFEFVMKRWRAVIVIQKFFKGWIARRTFSDHKQRIIHIQSAARGWLTRKQFIVLKNLKLSKLNQTNTNRSIQEIKDSNMGHLWVRRSVVEELEMRVLKAETLLRQKDEDHVLFQHRFEQYEAKMKSMEEMWQQQLMSLQRNPSEKHSEAHQAISGKTQRQSLNGPKEQGGWDILNLSEFNNALLGKWWWKIVNNHSWCGAQVLLQNYVQPGQHWNLYSPHPKRISFFWNGIQKCRPAFRSCVSDVPNNSSNAKLWTLTANSTFSVRSFYRMLVDGGLRCAITPNLFKGSFPRKISIFFWLACKNKILTLDNLARRGCNSLPTTTCVLCHSACESVDHLLLQCTFAKHIWHHFGSLLQISVFPNKVLDYWDRWRLNLRPTSRFIWDALSRAIVWNIWIERNTRIFSHSCASPNVVIRKITFMFILWMSVVPDKMKDKVEYAVSAGKRSLNFLGPQEMGLGDPESLTTPNDLGE